MTAPRRLGLRLAPVALLLAGSVFVSSLPPTADAPERWPQAVVHAQEPEAEASMMALPMGVVVEQLPGGFVDWTTGVLVVQASAVSNTGAWKDVKAIEQSAFQQLEPRLQTLSAGVRFTADTQAGDLLDEGGPLARSLTDGQAAWRVTETHYFASGRVELRAELPLHPWLRPALVSLADAPLIGEREVANTTGVVVDARGLRVEPALAPRLLTKDGEVLFGPEDLAPETAAERAPAIWALDPSQEVVIKRGGASPLFVRAVSVRGGADFVLDAEDVARLRTLRINTDLLASAPVVVVVDP